jgi:hypothetical protein
MLAAIRKVTDKPIKYLLYSHEHADHASGGQVFKDAGATLVSHGACVEHMKAPGQTAATMTWTGAYVITLGGKAVEMFNFGANHGHWIAFMRVPSEKLAYIVDIVCPHRSGSRACAKAIPITGSRRCRKLWRWILSALFPATDRRRH